MIHRFICLLGLSSIALHAADSIPVQLLKIKDALYMNWPGETGYRYQILKSSNLTNWNTHTQLVTIMDIGKPEIRYLGDVDSPENNFYLLEAIPSTRFDPLPHSLPFPEKALNQPSHFPSQGRFLIEAESGSGNWTKIDLPDNGQAILPVENQSMKYWLEFPESGIFYIYLYCHDGGDSSTNDAKILLGGVPLWGVDNETRPEGMRCHTRDFDWTSRPKGPGSHTPENIKDGVVHTLIPEPGTYLLEIGYRSPLFAIDKIMIQRSVGKPE